MPGAFIISGYELADLFFSQRQTVPLFTISLTSRGSTMCDGKDSRSIPFIDLQYAASQRRIFLV